MIKKFITAITGGAVMALALPAISFASVPVNPSVTAVSGVVTHNGNPVSGASVTVTCNSNVLNDVTDGTGTYEVDYSPASLCPDQSTASVSASSGNLSGSNSGPVGAQTPDLNIALVDVSVVPEMGTIAAISAAVLGGAAFLVVRRQTNDLNS